VNYLGDIGASPLNGTTGSYSVNVPSGHNLVVVVNAVNSPASQCSNYSATISGFFDDTPANGPCLPDLPAATVYLRGTGPDANPPTLFLGTAPTATTPKYRDSAGVNFAGGNPFKDIGTWNSTPSAGFLFSATPLRTWIGLKNSDDVGTRFDVRAQLYKNGTLVAEGLTRCIQGVARNPNDAKEITVPFGLFPATPFNGSDVLSLKVSTRIGTNPDGSKCAGHNNATGLREYFDSIDRPSNFGENQ
jgi:hypothetical protein